MSEKDIDVMIVEADKKPYMASIPNNMESIKEIVGGEINVSIMDGKDVALICDKDGLEEGREPNRILFDNEGEPYDIVYGNFVLTGVKDNDIISLSQDNAKEYYLEFHQPTFYGIRPDADGVEKEYSKESEPDISPERENDWDMERDFWNEEMF